MVSKPVGNFALPSQELNAKTGGLPYFEGKEDSWAWLCAHFQAPAFINKAKVNKGNRKKKTLLHHSGSRPFSYRMDARRRGGPNSQRSTSLATYMFDLGMSWPSPFIRRWWRGASWFFRSPCNNPKQNI
ncbi:hypothetical protein L3X38_023697 [Prunus dulcis]|uniref:Uncharacterized protein n=1 Tax=Prunus dulcis TaxID=3755 RepID=A0AAD4Z5H1_PRUDU|nr:hypothetical protein L3X38_023697 [Prunus dulcis]